MKTAKATALASALGGEVVAAMPQSRLPGVSITKPDGQYLLFDEDAGAIYRDEAACWPGDGAGVLDAWEWGDWGVTEDWATGLAALIGGEAWQSGGNIWVVLYQCPDGRFVVIGVDGADIYQSKDRFERYYEGGEPEPERVSWE
jgi:hypothetical protein